MTELIQENDTGAWDIEPGAKLYVGKREEHFIDGDLTDVFVFYYEVTNANSHYEDGEIHTSVRFDVVAPNQDLLTTLTLDFEDIEKAINNGRLKPTDLSYTELLRRDHML